MAAPKRITVQDLAAAIDNGGAVIHRGEIITHKDNLPSAADLKAAHEGKERVVYQTADQPTSAQTSTAVGDPLHLDEETGEQKPASVLPAGTDAAAAQAAAGNPPSNPEASASAKPKPA